MSLKSFYALLTLRSIVGTQSMKQLQRRIRFYWFVIVGSDQFTISHSQCLLNWIVILFFYFLLDISLSWNDCSFRSMATMLGIGHRRIKKKKILCLIVSTVSLSVCRLCVDYESEWERDPKCFDTEFQWFGRSGDESNKNWMPREPRVECTVIYIYRNDS